MDQICLVKETEIALRFQLAQLDTIQGKKETLKKTKTEDDRFLFGYAETEVLCKHSREGRNTDYVSQRRGQDWRTKI